MKEEILIISTVIFLTCGKKSYQGDQIWSVFIENDEDAKLLHQLQDSYDFWTGIQVGSSVDIHVEKGRIRHLTNFVRNARLRNKIAVENLQRLVEREEKFLQSRHSNFFETYHDWDENQEFLFEIVGKHSDAEIESIGTTFEGREMRMMKICENGSCGSNPAMYIHCTMHAREWITSGVCLYIINELTENKAANADLRTGIDWYILSIANPDGYVWSWTEERFYRMTRQPHVNGAGICIGVDPNRNSNVGFAGIRASPDPCSLDYPGPYPNSEMNLQNIRNFITSHPEIVYYQDLHAYSQMVLFPYAYTAQDCPDDAYLQALCDEANYYLFTVHNKTYQCGSAIDTLYGVGGTALDWVYDVAGLVNSFSFEGRPATAEEGGFAPDQGEILPNAQEIWAFHKIIAQRMKTFNKHHKN